MGIIKRHGSFDLAFLLSYLVIKPHYNIAAESTSSFSKHNFRGIGMLPSFPLQN